MSGIEMLPFWAAIVALIVIAAWASLVIKKQEEYIEFLSRGIDMIIETKDESIAELKRRLSEALDNETDNS